MHVPMNVDFQLKPIVDWSFRVRSRFGTGAMMSIKKEQEAHGTNSRCTKGND